MASEEEAKQIQDQKETEDKQKQKTDEEVFPKPAVPAKPAKLDKNKADIEKEQELKLRSKYPALKGPGSSNFLQKRLSKGQKFFDSGDYNMARAKGGGNKPFIPGQKLLLGPGTTGSGAPATGEEIPTPDTVPARKSSIVPPTHPSQHQFTPVLPAAPTPLSS